MRGSHDSRGNLVDPGCPADPPELEFSVFLPCGCKLELDGDQALDVEAQILEQIE